MSDLDPNDFNSMQELINAVLKDDKPEAPKPDNPEENLKLTDEAAQAPQEAVQANREAKEVTQCVISDTDGADEVSIPSFSTKLKEENKNATLMAVPVFTDEELMDSIDLRRHAVLVSFHTSRWHAKVKDRKASRAAAAASGTTEQAFETRKHLLHGADEKLKAVHKAIDMAKVAHYAMTLPWTSTAVNEVAARTGHRLLPNARFIEYTTKMAECKKAMQDALDEFVPAYPAMVAQAQKNLKGAFNPAEYPDPNDVRKLFVLSFSFHPIPLGEDFGGLADTQLKQLKVSLEKKTRKMVERAMQELWVNIHDDLTNAVSRLSSPKNRLHETVITKLQQHAQNIPKMNITNDRKLEKVREALDSRFRLISIDDVRKDDDLRASLHRAAKQVLSLMNTLARS